MRSYRICRPYSSAKIHRKLVRVLSSRAADICGDAIPAAPARGPVRVFQPMSLYPDGDENWTAQPSGYRGRSALQRADVFDVMAAKSRSSGKPSPFTRAQVTAGRAYRDLVERHACAGLRCSSIEGVRSGAGGGGSFIDAVLRDRADIARLHRRIGSGISLVVRKIRPSARGSRVNITDRRLVDMVCLEDKPLSAVLPAHGWAWRSLVLSLHENDPVRFRCLAAAIRPRHASNSVRSALNLLSASPGSSRRPLSVVLVATLSRFGLHRHKIVFS